MATITVKKSRKPEHLRGNSANRYAARKRAEKLANEQIEQILNATMPMIETKTISRVEKAISIRSTKVYDSVDNCCLPNVAVFSGVKTKQPSSEFGVTAR